MKRKKRTIAALPFMLLLVPTSGTTAAASGAAPPSVFPINIAISQDVSFVPVVCSALNLGIMSLPQATAAFSSNLSSGLPGGILDDPRNQCAPGPRPIALVCDPRACGCAPTTASPNDCRGFSKICADRGFTDLTCNYTVNEDGTFKMTSCACA